MQRCSDGPPCYRLWPDLACGGSCEANGRRRADVTMPCHLRTHRPPRAPDVRRPVPPCVAGEWREVRHVGSKAGRTVRIWAGHGFLGVPAQNLPQKAAVPGAIISSPATWPRSWRWSRTPRSAVRPGGANCGQIKRVENASQLEPTLGAREHFLSRLGRTLGAGNHPGLAWTTGPTTETELAGIPDRHI